MSRIVLKGAIYNPNLQNLPKNLSGGWRCFIRKLYCSGPVVTAVTSWWDGLNFLLVQELPVYFVRSPTVQWHMREIVFSFLCGNLSPDDNKHGPCDSKLCNQWHSCDILITNNEPMLSLKIQNFLFILPFFRRLILLCKLNWKLKSCWKIKQQIYSRTQFGCRPRWSLRVSFIQFWSIL